MTWTEINHTTVNQEFVDCLTRAHPDHTGLMLTHLQEMLQRTHTEASGGGPRKLFRGWKYENSGLKLVLTFYKTLGSGRKDAPPVRRFWNISLGHAATTGMTDAAVYREVKNLCLHFYDRERGTDPSSMGPMVQLGIISPAGSTLSAGRLIDRVLELMRRDGEIRNKAFFRPSHNPFPSGELQYLQLSRRSDTEPSDVH